MRRFEYTIPLIQQLPRICIHLRKNATVFTYYFIELRQLYTRYILNRQL